MRQRNHMLSPSGELSLRGRNDLVDLRIVLGPTDSLCPQGHQLDAPAHSWGYYHELVCGPVDVVHSMNATVNRALCGRRVLDPLCLANPSFCYGTAKPFGSVVRYSRTKDARVIFTSCDVGLRSFFTLVCGAIRKCRSLLGLGKSPVYSALFHLAPRCHFNPAGVPA